MAQRKDTNIATDVTTSAGTGGPSRGASGYDPKVTDSRTRAYERRRVRTRAAITDAALDIVRERGFDRLTAEEIAQRAGCSRATFYLHFESKSHAVVAALEALWANQDALSEGFGRALRQGTSRQTLLAALQEEVRNSSTPVAALHAATLSDELIADWFFREQDRAFAILLDGQVNIHDPAVRSLRARFHILGQITLSTMATRPASSTDISADETIAYISELWIDLLESLPTRGALAD